MVAGHAATSDMTDLPLSGFAFLREGAFFVAA
jgi:hypothetical protein